MMDHEHDGGSHLSQDTTNTHTGDGVERDIDRGAVGSADEGRASGLGGLARARQRVASFGARVKLNLNKESLAALGRRMHPILGDKVYGDGERDRRYPALTRQALHCGTLEFEHPLPSTKGQALTLEADLPGDLRGLVDEGVS